jgi:cytoskeletal protein CcmA (bactofilin family)
MWKREKPEPIDQLEEVMTDPTASLPLPARPVAQPPAPAAETGPNRTSTSPSSSSSSSAAKCSTLGATLRFKGDLVADEDLVIQGQVEGSILHTRSVTIGAQGRVQGNTRARRIVVEGNIDGNLYALESVTIRSGATVRGDVFAPRVSVDEGARLSGRIDMDNAPAIPTINIRIAETSAEDEQDLSGQEVDTVLTGS